MNCRLAEATRVCLVLAAALPATVSQAQNSADTTRSLRPLARCIVAQQFDSPDKPAWCADDDVDSQAARLGPMLRHLDESCCDEPYAVALEALAAELGHTGSARQPMSVNPDRLEAVLAEMQLQDDSSSRSWWQRFMDWLIEALEADEDRDDSALIDWLENLTLPEWAATAIRWTLYTLLFGTAALIVINELRVAGVFRRYRRPAAPPAATAGPARASDAGALPADIERLEPLEQAVALFGSALDTLRSAGALPPDDSLTNLELARRLHPDDRLRRPFDRLRSSADRALYAELAPGEDELDSLRRAWRACVSFADPDPETVTP